MSLPFVMLFLHEPVLYIICYLLLSLGTMMRTLCNTKQGWWISSEDGSSNKYAFGKMLVISSEPPSSWRDCSSSLAKNTTICAWWVLWRGAIWLELGWDHRWTPKGACESDDFRSWMFRGQATYSGVFFFFLDTNCFCVCREEKLLLHIEVAAQIIYLIILIVILIFGLWLRKRKNNNSSFNVAIDVTSNTQITIEPTCLALNSTMDKV